MLIAQSEQLPERQGVNIVLKETQERREEEILNTGNTGRTIDFVLIAELPYLMPKKQSV